MKCRYCKTESPPQTRICPKCGEPFPKKPAPEACCVAGLAFAVIMLLFAILNYPSVTNINQMIFRNSLYAVFSLMALIFCYLIFRAQKNQKLREQTEWEKRSKTV